MTATETALPPGAQRHLYLDRRVCTITPDRLEVHPARSIVFLPLLGLLLGIAAFPAIYFGGSSLSLEVRLLLTVAAVLLVPLSGVGLVYSIAGAHIVVDRRKQSAVVQQGYLGMGVGTQELIPFWKIDRVRVVELTPPEEDVAQYEVSIIKVSGKQVSVGTVTVARPAAKEGRARAREVASIIAELAGSRVQVARMGRRQASPS